MNATPPIMGRESSTTRMRSGKQHPPKKVNTARSRKGKYHNPRGWVFQCFRSRKHPFASNKRYTSRTEEVTFFNEQILLSNLVTEILFTELVSGSFFLIVWLDQHTNVLCCGCVFVRLYGWVACVVWSCSANLACATEKDGQASCNEAGTNSEMCLTQGQCERGRHGYS